MKDFLGYHSEWNLGSPGGWDYQRITQIIGKAVWQRLNEIYPIKVKLDFDHPMFSPVHGFVKMLVEAHREIQGNIIHAREMVLSRQKGLIRDQTYAIRLYEPQTLAKLLEQAGFKKVMVYSDFSRHRLKGDYGFMNRRMIATGRKI